MKLYKPEEMADKKPEALINVIETYEGDILIKLVSPIGDWLANVGVINSDGFHASGGCKGIAERKGYKVPFKCNVHGTIKCRVLGDTHE